jgi:hypothetical protein
MQGDKMFRADVDTLKVSVVAPTPSSGEEESSSRHSECFQVSGTWDSGEAQSSEEEVLIAAVDAKMHLMWSRALFQEQNQLDKHAHQSTEHVSTHDPESLIAANERQSDRLLQSSEVDLKDLEDRATKSNEASSSSSSSQGDTQAGAQQPASTKASEADQPASSSAAEEAKSSSPLPEMLKLVLRQPDKKQSAGDAIEADVAAVLVDRCPHLLRSLGNTRRELYQQSALHG